METCIEAQTFLGKMKFRVADEDIEWLEEHGVEYELRKVSPVEQILEVEDSEDGKRVEITPHADGSASLNVIVIKQTGPQLSSE